MTELSFILNGSTVEVADQPPTRTLLDWLREDRGLKGTKEGCNEGDCGACTVMVSDENGTRALNACILFLPQLQGKAVRTVEGLRSPDGALHPVQKAMVDHHGSQCGFCTPGMLLTVQDLAQKNPQATREQIREHISGNYCRCTGYQAIVDAVETVLAARQGKT